MELFVWWDIDGEGTAVFVPATDVSDAKAQIILTSVYTLSQIGPCDDIYPLHGGPIFWNPYQGD